MSYRAFLSRWRRESHRRGRWNRQVVLLIPGEGEFQWRDHDGWHVVRLFKGKIPTYRQATYPELEAIRRAYAVGAVQVEERVCGKTLGPHRFTEVLLGATGMGPGEWIDPEGGHEIVRLHREISCQYAEARS